VIGSAPRSLRLSCGFVRESQRQVIYAIRVHDVILELHELENIAARMRERLAHRGESSADVVMLQGDAKETLRLFGMPYSVNRVRAAMFSAAIRWTPIDLD
jgi:predicted kinase